MCKVRIEPLSIENLREGFFCPGDDPRGEKVYEQMQAWLAGDVLRGRVAYSDSDQVAGFVLYYPIEQAPVDFEGEDFYMVQCVLVKPEFAGQGIASALIAEALKDAAEHGAAGLAAEARPIHDAEKGSPMAALYEQLGMKLVESRGDRVLYFTRLRENAREPSFAKQRFRPPPGEQKVRVDILDCRRCYTASRNADVVQEVLRELGDQVEVHIHDQNSRQAVLDKGMSTGVFIDGALTFFKPIIDPEDVMTALEAALVARRTLPRR